jgi:hypothetical protein
MPRFVGLRLDLQTGVVPRQGCPPLLPWQAAEFLELPVVKPVKSGDALQHAGPATVEGAAVTIAARRMNCL